MVWSSRTSKTRSPLRTVFFGSPPFAVPSFRRLVEGGLAPVGLVTAPARRAGRGRRELENELVTLAEAAGIPVLRPSRADDLEFLMAFRSWEPELGIVVAYGQILRRSLLDIPREGFINVHGSLLPRWRGASPVQAAILAGDAETGVSIQRVVEALDAGAVLAERRIPLDARERGDALFVKLAELGAECLADFVRDLGEGPLPAGEEQDEEAVTVCRKIRRQEGAVDWTRSAQEVDRLVRAMAGWPWAFSRLPGGQEVRILEGVVRGEHGTAAPGTIVALEPGIQVQCGQGTFQIDRLQRPGKAALASDEFLRGLPVEVGQRWASAEGASS